MSFKSGFDYLRNCIKQEQAINDCDEIRVYLPIKTFRKLLYEVSQTQRGFEEKGAAGFTQEIVLFDMFRIRPESELMYLESVYKEIKRLVR